MSPDPFRALDRIDPPDRWDEVVRRAGSDDLDLEVDTVSAPRPRRRAALLVAAAAAVALVAGVAIAGVGDPDEGVTAEATEPPSPSTAPAAPNEVVPGACPFALDPSAELPALAPGRSPVENADVGPAEEVVTWGHLTVDDLPVEVAVSGTPGEPSIRSDGAPGIGPVVVDVFSDAPRVTVAAWDVVGDEGPCATLTVYGHLPLRAEDAALGEPPVAGELPPTDADLAPYVDAARATLERVRDAVVVEADDPSTTTEPAVADLGGPCPFTLAGADLPVPEPHELEVTPDDLPGAVGTAGLVTVDGVEVTILLGGLPDLGEPILGPVGTIEAVEAGAVDPATGTVRVAGHQVVSDVVPCTDLQAWATVPEAEVDPAITVVERVLAAVVPRSEALDAREDELEDQIAQEAREYQERLAALQAAAEQEAEDEACAADPVCAVVAWEGPTDDGRTYRVEVDGDTTRGFIGDVLYGEAEEATPSWTDPMRSAGLWFSSDGSAGTGDVFDAVIVGAIPPGTVESVVLDEAGDPVAAPTLTFSPDGRFYALFAGDLRPPVPGTGARAVRHRAADGTLFPNTPRHDR